MPANAKKLDPPAYITSALFDRFINSLRDSIIPSRIDRSVLSKMSGAEQSALLAALRFLKLIKSDGTPTDKLTQLVESKGENYKAALRIVLETAYEFLLKSDVDLTNATGQQVADKFRELQISGSTVTKSMTFFLAMAKEAGIQVSDHVKPPVIARAQNGGRKRKSSKQHVASKKDEAPPPPPPPASTWNQQLLEKFPAFDPSWEEDTKKEWFSAFNELMKKGG